MSREYLYEHRVLFLEKVGENDPGDEGVMRGVLNLDGDQDGGGSGSGSISATEN